ncbi:hypothetical protein A0H81_01315 [Grifola frondosa]|uniref:F-box domain-containing protein n=1 Tax=Grifola frondosa TaxID=5627 RepID=A0A1C7MQ61_GRIFR|nr:hypothetical protein A0H81_01315 [Grifola frondosa]
MGKSPPFSVFCFEFSFSASSPQHTNFRRRFPSLHKITSLNQCASSPFSLLDPLPPAIGMAYQSSRLLALPGELLETVALEVALFDPLGPPHHLLPLLLTCRPLNHAFAFTHNPTLYSRMFHCKFDTQAARRRCPGMKHSPAKVAAQLRQYLDTMKHIRACDIYCPNLIDVLWSAFIMLVENDGRNEEQLAWAGLDAFLDEYITTRLLEGRHSIGGWPLESTRNTLVIWLYWLSMTEEKYNAMTVERSRQIMTLISPYAIIAVRYSSFHAPDNHFDFPIGEELLYGPPGEKVMYYDRRITIAAPPIALAAKLLYTSLYEKLPLLVPDDIPRNREHAIQMGYVDVKPTQADYVEFNSRKAVQLRKRGDWDWLSRLSVEQRQKEMDGVWRKDLTSLSSRWDNDWNRWTGCIDPTIDLPLKGVVFTFGSMAGSFAGRMLVPNIGQYGDIARAVVFPETFSDSNPRITFAPVYFQLREHHCINPEEPLATGGVGDGFDDGVNNGWCPRVEFRERHGQLQIYNMESRHMVRYETYVEGRPNSHDEATCKYCIGMHEMEEDEFRERVRARERAESDEDEVMEDDEGADLALELMEVDPAAAAPSRSPSRSSFSSTRSYTDEDEIRSARADVQSALGNSDLDDLLAQAAGYDDASDDGDSDCEEYIENECNGIRDIILTGETSQHHGQAWHHYRFYGRVRKWDGLVTLVRVPVHVPQLGVFIFRGYFVGNANFVGSWRTFSNNIHAGAARGPVRHEQGLRGEANARLKDGG